MILHQDAFTWNDAGHGHFWAYFFLPIDIPVVPHTPWVLQNIPIPQAFTTMFALWYGRKWMLESLSRPIHLTAPYGFVSTRKTIFRSAWFNHSNRSIKLLSDTQASLHSQNNSQDILLGTPVAAWWTSSLAMMSTCSRLHRGIIQHSRCLLVHLD